MDSIELRSADVDLFLPDVFLLEQGDGAQEKEEKGRDHFNREQDRTDEGAGEKTFPAFHTFFSEGDSQSRGVESAQGVLAAKCSSLLCRPLYLRHRLPPDKNQLNLRHPCLLLPLPRQ